MELDELNRRLSFVESRNKRVEANKKWETSLVRRSSIFVLTYISVVFYHLAIGAENVLIISFVPALGYMLSTLSLAFIRSLFEREPEI